MAGGSDSVVVGLFTFLKSGSHPDCKLEDLAQTVQNHATGYRDLSDWELRTAFRDALTVEETLAVGCEAAQRTLGYAPYREQVMAAGALVYGWVAEMQTGEGKTLAVALAALAGGGERGVHVVTANEYLAKRDTDWMGPLYAMLGVSCGVLDGVDHKVAYGCDVVYGTSPQFAFDYLRDNLETKKGNVVGRGRNFAIVDEIDFVLIDSARTPVTISGKRQSDTAQHQKMAGLAAILVEGEHYEVDRRERVVSITEPGVEKTEQFLGIEDLYQAEHRTLIHALDVAIVAKELYIRDKDYLVEGDKIQLIDPHTGRILQGRQLADGVQQAVEAKEGVELSFETHTLASISYQNFFRGYEHLCGTTGTATSAAGEFASVYNLQVVAIPTHLPCVRIDHDDAIYATTEGKLEALVSDVKQRHERGQPVLVGVGTVEGSIEISKRLTKAGIVHSVLSARDHDREADIIAQAGRAGAVTVATVMAGRGVDIVLGGNAELLAEKAGGEENFEALYEHYKQQCLQERHQVVAAGGLHVVGTERNATRRQDQQLRGRSGRQGDPGSSRFYLSLQDDMVVRLAGRIIGWLQRRDLPDGVPLQMKQVATAITRAQETAEGLATAERKKVFDYDDVLEAQRKVVYARRCTLRDGTDVHEIADRAMMRALDSLLADVDVDDWQGAIGALRSLYPTGLQPQDMEGFATREEFAAHARKELRDGLGERERLLGSGRTRDLEQKLLLQVLDANWVEHLRRMDALRDGIGLRATGRLDPLGEWRREGSFLFEEMMADVDWEFTSAFARMTITINDPSGKLQEVLQANGGRLPAGVLR